ncbi:hypothetical protein JCM8097_001380 [Rhodosporidiobolus ruineniae]
MAASPSAAPQTPTPAHRTKASVSYATAASSPPSTRPPKPALAPLRLNSSSPIPKASKLPPHSVGAPVKHARFDRRASITTVDDDDEVQDEPASPTVDASSKSMKSKRAERRKLSRSEGNENSYDSPIAVQTRKSRSATFSRVTSSDRNSLVGLGQRQATPAPTPPRPSKSTFASPPRAPGHSTASPLATTLSLRQFDRSACPENEDSFYSHLSNLSLGGGFSSISSSPFTSPASSLRLKSTLSSPDLSRQSRPSPLQPLNLSSSSPFKQPLFQSSGQISPTTLLSRGPYVDPSRWPHPEAIVEEEEEDDDDQPAHAHDQFETLSATEEAALGLTSARSWADEHDEGEEDGVEVCLRLAQRKPSLFGAQSVTSPPGVPLDEVDEDVCSGCGSEKNVAFVNLVPCSHSLCHVCVNALINGAAHKPPRPTDCFACNAPVESFVPAIPAVGVLNGGGGLCRALKGVLDEEDASGMGRRRVGRRASVAGTVATEDDDQHQQGQATTLVKSRRRRSSVVAAAIAATLLAQHVQSTPPAAADEKEDKGGKPPADSYSRRSSLHSVDSFKSIGSLPSSTADKHSLQPASPTSPSPAKRSSRRKSVSTSTPAPGATNAVVSTAEQPSLPPAVDWPVVRLDNVPWEITVREIEEWVASASLTSAGEAEGDEAMLASEVDDEGLRMLGEGVKRVTLAVHVLCNRVDGRTLNQAYLELASLAAARRLVRTKDGSVLRRRAVHVSLASQAELLTTLFPTYTPGFSSLSPNPPPSASSSSTSTSKWAPKAAPVPLLLQTELTGLLTLCRVESAHARKVPERPYFQLVTLLEKMPWSFPWSYNSQAVVRLFNTCCAAIEILGTVKRQIGGGWREVLTVLVDAILHCPVFRPQQKQKAVRLAANIGFEHALPAVVKRERSSIPTAPSTGIRNGVFDAFHPVPSSLKESYVGTAPSKGFLAAHPVDGKDPTEASAGTVDAQLVDEGVPEPRFEDEGVAAADDDKLAPPSSANEGLNTVLPRQQHHRRRRSSVAAQLNIDKALVESVARALGISLEPSSPKKGGQ